jgi:hypothetical protein
VPEQPTCGQGLAANATLPAKLGEVIAAMADVLETHTAALDLADENGRMEQDAYVNLVAHDRETAARLAAIAERMTGYRDLPMARHDPAVLTSAEAADVFERLVTVEEELLALLEERREQHRTMLAKLGRRPR